MTDAKPAPEKPAAKPTHYEISVLEETAPIRTDLADHEHIYRRVATVDAFGAQAAIRTWADEQGDKFTGGRVRAVPLSNITEVVVKIETKRAITLA